MVKCTYCNKEFESFRGVMLVNSVTGKISNFCSRKCRAYASMGRRKGKWAKGK